MDENLPSALLSQLDGILALYGVEVSCREECEEPYKENSVEVFQSTFTEKAYERSVSTKFSTHKLIKPSLLERFEQFLTAVEVGLPDAGCGIPAYMPKVIVAWIMLRYA
jgi:hypothetical protein